MDANDRYHLRRPHPHFASSRSTVPLFFYQQNNIFSTNLHVFWLQMFVRLHDMRQKGPVYIHCNTGVHRSMTIVAGLFYYIDRLPLSEVEEIVYFLQKDIANIFLYNYQIGFA